MSLYSFEEFSLDSEQYRLQRGAEEIRLQPQVLELLRHLIENRGRLVSKQELVEQVWQGRHVSDAALNRAVSDARRSLGDDPREPRFIATVHGRGYRFVAEVERIDRAKEAAAQRAALADETAAAEVARVAGGRRGVRWAIGGAVALALAAALIAVTPDRRGDEPLPVESRPRLAVLPPSSSGASSHLLGLAITDLLVTRLDSSPPLDVVPPERAGALVAEAPSLAEFAAETSTDWAVELALEPLDGDRHLVATTLYGFTGSGGVERFRFATHELRLDDTDAGLEALLEAREAIVRDLVAAILPAVDLAPEEGLRPVDPAAYRLYLVASDRVRAGRCRDAVVASELLDRALERDPGFAPAWAQACSAQHSAAVLCGWSRTRRATAEQACERALALAPGLTSAAAAKAILLTETGRAEDAYEIVLGQRGRVGDHPLLAQIGAFVLRYAGFLDQAEATIEALVTRNPGWYVVHVGKPNALLYLRRHDRYLELLPRLETPMYRFYRGWVEWQRGERERAREVLEPAFRSDPGDQFARLSEALLALLENRPEEARLVVGQLARERQRRRAVDGEMTYKVAELLALSDAADAALDQLDLAVRQGFFCSSCMVGSPAFLDLHRSAKFRQVLGRAHRRHLEFGRRFGLPPETLVLPADSGAGPPGPLPTAAASPRASAPPAAGPPARHASGSGRRAPS